MYSGDTMIIETREYNLFVGPIISYNCNSTL